MLHVICGAPCSGKTTYVNEHANPNTLIIDADKIANAFGGSQYQATGEPLKVALDARELAIEHALKTDSEAWLIDSKPSEERLRRYVDAKADVVLLDTPYEECMKRAEKRPNGTKQAINKWFSGYDSLKEKIDSIGGKKMNETVNQENEAKTFTQDEVNVIVGDRLKREREKYADYESLKDKALKYDEMEAASKSELEKAKEKAQALEAELNGLKKSESIRVLREQIANEAGIPSNLLSGEDEESLRTQASAIKEFAKGNAYPQVKDGGEVTQTMKSTTREQFKEWWDGISQ